MRQKTPGTDQRVAGVGRETVASGGEGRRGTAPAPPVGLNVRDDTNKRPRPPVFAGRRGLCCVSGWNPLKLHRPSGLVGSGAFVHRLRAAGQAAEPGSSRVNFPGSDRSCQPEPVHRQANRFLIRKFSGQ